MLLFAPFLSLVLAKGKKRRGDIVSYKWGRGATKTAEFPCLRALKPEAAEGRLIASSLCVREVLVG